MTGNCAAAVAGRRAGTGADESRGCATTGDRRQTAGVGQLPAREGDLPRRPQRSHQSGAVYMTYQWWVGACNELTGITSIRLQNAGNQILCGESGSDCRPAMGGALCTDGLQRHGATESRCRRLTSGRSALPAAAGGLRRRQLFLHQPHPHGDAGADQRIVKVIAGVMQRLRRGFRRRCLSEIGPGQASSMQAKSSEAIDGA